MRARCNGYALLGDPAFLAASIRSYYPLVDKIFLSHDRDGLSWSGRQLPIDACTREAEAADPEGKIVFLSGRYARPKQHPLDSETEQRRQTLEAASAGVDWTLQIDSDEIVPDLQSFSSALAMAHETGANALDYPSRWFYSRAEDGRYLERSSRWWRVCSSYPGPLAVRAGTRLTLARQCEGRHYRVDVRRRNADPARPATSVVHAVVPASSAILHFSWVRTRSEMEEKALISGHAGDFDWRKRISDWTFRSAHPWMTVAATPLRSKDHFRLVQLTSAPPTRASAAAGAAQ